MKKMNTYHTKSPSPPPGFLFLFLTKFFFIYLIFPMYFIAHCKKEHYKKEIVRFFSKKKNLNMIKGHLWLFLLYTPPPIYQLQRQGNGFRWLSRRRFSSLGPIMQKLGDPSSVNTRSADHPGLLSSAEDDGDATRVLEKSARV